MKILLSPFKQESTQMYVGTMTVGDLLKATKVDVYRKDEEGEKGYQRAPESARGMKVAKYLKSDPKPLIPTAVLLSYRGKLLSAAAENGLVSVDLSEDENLWTIDGQHRLLGFEKAITEMGIERLKDYQLPVVIVENPSITEEASLFRVINETMKKVRTDLARHILAMQLASEGPGRRDAVRQAGRLWEANAVEICKALSSDPDSPWAGRIQGPNEKKDERHVVRELSFTTALKPILTVSPYKNYRPDRIAKLLINYWNAWRELVPEPFETPDDFVLLKTPGVFSCHLLAEHVLEVLRRQDITDPSVGDFKTIIQDLGEFIDAQKWHVQNSDGVAMAGSMKGFSLTADAMIETLIEEGHDR